MRLIILGAPGSGTDSQASRLAERFSIMHISAGDLLRTAVNGGSVPASAIYGTAVPRGSVPDPVIVEMVCDQVVRPEARNGFILNGFPRTVDQAVIFDHILSDLGMRLDAAVEFKTDKAVFADRTMAQEAGAAARVEEAHGGDDPEILTVRLEAYRKQVFPLVKYYKRTGLLLRVDVSMPVDLVSARILNFADSLLPF
jgi:adenylate kinase